ncbi:MAG: LysM peptidoglycan-binding domain-containing protein [Syntrophomonadaceae bacterium]|nr:LysM peptidoglycan-binding domain-containing protein [Syntrophomonadaceae bacterium]
MKGGWLSRLLMLAMLVGAAGLFQPGIAGAASLDSAPAVQQRLAREIELTETRGGTRSGALECLEKIQAGEPSRVDGLTSIELAALTLEQKRFAYQVKSGDSLYLISLSRGTTVEQLKKLNRLNQDQIYPGQKLIVPASSTAESSRGGMGGETRGDIPTGQGAARGRLADWWTDASKTFGLYEKALVTDIETGKSFWVVRRGGSKHADCQPLTFQDTRIMLENYGGQWSWARRAIVVTVEGQQLAASQNGMPHGEGAIKDNGFPGHFCIHFLNSRTHGTNNIDPRHQAMIRKAAGL